MTHIGIICALPVEVAPFTQLIQFEERSWRGTMPCWQGEDEGKTITLVQSGVGKVHAAVATQMLISQFAPEAIFSCGTAGSLDPQYQIGDLIVAESTTQHDYGFILPGKFIPYGLKIETNQNVEFLRAFPADGELLRVAKVIGARWNDHARIVYGSILTGDQVILSSEKRQALVDQFQALAVDMESAAIAQVACLHAVPFLAVRGISDYADETLPIDTSKLDPNEFGAYAAASPGEKMRLLTKALSYFALHPSAFALSLQARRNIKKAAQTSATFSVNLIRALNS